MNKKQVIISSNDNIPMLIGKVLNVLKNKENENIKIFKYANQVSELMAQEKDIKYFIELSKEYVNLKII